MGPEASSPNASLPLLLSFQDWSANPMFERKDNKKEALLDLDGRTAHLNKRYTAVKDAGLKIQAMVAVRRRPPGRVFESPPAFRRREGCGCPGNDLAL